jgi:hypothetical protein
VICETQLTMGEIVMDENPIEEITREFKEQQGWFCSEQFEPQPPICAEKNNI